MTKRIPPVPHPVKITVATDIELWTTIDPGTKRHRVQCDICKSQVRLTTTGHPDRFFQHRNFCYIKAEREKALVQEQHPTPALAVGHHQRPRYPANSSLSELSTSLSNLRTNSPFRPTVLNHFSQNPLPTSQQPEKPMLCHGTQVDWTPGSIWVSYPYHQHEVRMVGWSPIAFNSKTNTITLRSDKCSGSLSKEEFEAPCRSCRNVPYSTEFRDFIERATEAKPHTPWHYLTSDQMQGLLAKMAAELRILRTKVCIYFF